MKPPVDEMRAQDGFRTGYLKLRSVTYDRNTGLPAFPVLFDRLRSWLEDRRELGVLHVEIVNLAMVESLYGWQVFDRIVSRVADRLREAIGTELPAGALLSVNGVAGDRFVIFVPEAGDSAKAAARIGRKLERAFDSADFVGLAPEICFRVGHATFSDNPFYRFERCVYAAVEQARSAHERREQRRDLSWGEELQKIIHEAAVKTVFQPVLDLESHAVLGYEALVRGPADTLFETPRAMFALSDRMGIATELDHVCCEATLETFARVVGSGKLFINVLPGSLDEVWCAERLLPCLAEQDLAPADVVLEISERNADAGFDELMRRLRAAGFLLAIDDVGTGRVGLEAIARVEPDYLKFDISLVRDIHENLIQQDLLLTVTRLAERIGAEVIAEGVESDAEAVVLRDGGARFAQGFHFAHPAAKRWTSRSAGNGKASGGAGART